VAYNKAKAEREWLRWKEAEEKKLRELGVDEDAIQRLHTYDWEQFNKERQYRQRQVEWQPYMEEMSAQELELPIEDAESLLDSVEDPQLFSFLCKADKLTLKIVLMKTAGYTSKEIAERLRMEEYAVHMRLYRLRKQFKNTFPRRKKP